MSKEEGDIPISLKLDISQSKLSDSGETDRTNPIEEK